MKTNLSKHQKETLKSFANRHMAGMSAEEFDTLIKKYKKEASK